MINVKEFFELSQLAEASYADLVPGKILEVELKNADNNMSFSNTQAAELVKNWSLVTKGHQSNTDSGYSSTLFQNKEDGSYVFAIRGTEPFAQIPGDLGADIGDIVSDGLAIEQIVDMHNEWLRIISPGVYAAAQVEVLASETAQLNALVGPQRVAYLAYLAATRDDVIIDTRTVIEAGVPVTFPVVVTINYVNSDVLFNDGRQTGLGLEADILDKGLTVTGHSLGGHLASAFTRLFPETYAQALTINGAGFGRLGLSGFASPNVNNLFSLLHGEPGFDPNAVHNLYGDKNLEVVTQNGYWLFQPGAHESIFIEQQDFLQDTLAHGSGQMTDALAVYDLFFRLTNNASLTDLQPVFEQASNSRDPSFESLVNALGDLFDAGTEITTMGDREELHARIHAIRTNETFMAMAGLLTLTEATGENARNDYGQFLSLYFLSPFALQSSEALLAQLNPALYEQWLSDKNLTAAERASGQAAFSDQWLADRAAMLEAINTRNETDYTDAVMPAPRDLHFVDAATDTDLVTGSILTEGGIRDSIKFAGNTDSNLLGGSAKDRLYGGPGNDVLDGGADNDYLEGGIGNDALNGGDGDDQLVGGHGDDVLDGGEGKDTLEGGIGNDTYIFNGSFGFDEIKDLDGIGNIIINNQTVGEVKLVDGTDTIYRSADGNIDVLRINEGSSTTLMLSQRAGGVGDGGMVVIRDWSEGDLGITLNNEAETPTPPAQTFIGNENSNVVGYTGPFLGGDPIAHMDGGAGDDLVRGLMGDTLLGGIGDDWIIARYQTGRDLLTTHIDGGEGNDVISTVNINSIIHGGAGNDFIQDSAEIDVRLTEGLYRRADGTGIQVTREALWQDFLSYIVRVPDATRPEFYNLGPITRPNWEQFASAQDGISYYHRTHEQNINGFIARTSQVYYGEEMPDEDFNNSFDDAFTGFVYVSMIPATGISYESVQDKKGSSYFGDAGYDTIYGRWFADYISGGTEDDRLYGMEGHDVIDGGEHNDSIYGGEGNDTLIGSAGDDIIYGADASPADDKIDLPDDDVMFGGDGNDTLRGGRGKDTLNGGKDNDYLYGDEGDDYLDGGDGKDNLYGGIGNDTLVSGEGSFYLNGGEGDDTYILAKGLIQNDSETGALSSIDDTSGNNTLAITGVADFSSLGVTASGNNLIIDTGDGQFTIRNGLTNGMLNMAVGTAADEYASGNSPLPSTTPTTTQTSLNHLLLTHLNTSVTRTSQIAGEQLTGGLQNDTLTAHTGGSTLIGGRGNDALRGGVGDDTYLLRLGDGLDTITEAGVRFGELEEIIYRIAA